MRYSKANQAECVTKHSMTRSPPETERLANTRGFTKKIWSLLIYEIVSRKRNYPAQRKQSICTTSVDFTETNLIAIIVDDKEETEDIGVGRTEWHRHHAGLHRADVRDLRSVRTSQVFNSIERKNVYILNPFYKYIVIMGSSYIKVVVFHLSVTFSRP